MRPAKIVAIVVGAVVVLIGLALLVPGGFLLGVYGTQRDSSGFFETSSRVVSTSGYALSTPDVNLNVGSELGNWIPTGAKAAVRIRAASTGAAPVFIGIGPTDQVSEYLSGVAHDEVTDFGWSSASVRYRHVDGGAPASSPGQEGLWVAQQEGSGSQTLEWDVQDGDWTAVIMNGDATAPVTVSASVGARFGIILPIGIGLVAGGIALLAIGIALIVIGAWPSRQRLEVESPPAAAGPPQQLGPPQQPPLPPQQPGPPQQP